MSSSQTIKLPNGLSYEQPTGLFIDNQFIAGDGAEFQVINPTYGRQPTPALPKTHLLTRATVITAGPRTSLSSYKVRPSPPSTQPLQPPAKLSRENGLNSLLSSGEPTSTSSQS